MKLTLVRLFALSMTLATPSFAGNEGPHIAPLDACGAPWRVDYVKFVTAAGIRGCGQTIADFNPAVAQGSITRLNGLQDPNLYYSILVQDPSTGKSISSVVKCDVTTRMPSLLTLDFAAINAYGGCSR